MTKIWTAVVEEDPDDPESLMLPLPEDLLTEVGWKPGDTLIWDIEDERIFLRKK